MNIREKLSRISVKWWIIGLGSIGVIIGGAIFVGQGIISGSLFAQIPAVKMSGDPKENCKVLQQQWKTLTQHKLDKDGINEELLKKSRELVESLKALKDEADTKSIGTCNLNGENP